MGSRKLSKYRAKRDFTKTAEPSGAIDVAPAINPKAQPIAVNRAGGVTRAIVALRGTDTSEVDHDLADDWQRRLDFDANGHL